MTTFDDPSLDERVDAAAALPEAAVLGETPAPVTRVAAVRQPGDGFVGRFLPPVVMFAVFVGIWYVYSTLAFDQAFQRRNALPYPHEVVQDGFLPFWDTTQGTREILGYMWPTVKVTLLGLAISIVVGVFIAVVMNVSKYFERAIFPYAVVAQTVPVLAITPLLTQVFGDRLGVRLAVVFLIAVFPIITNTLFGLQSTERLHHDLFTLNKASRWTRLWKLELPAAVPALMTGIRIASGLSVIGAIVADFFFNQGDKGIGYFIRVTQQKAADRPDMLAGTIAASLFGVVMFLIVGAITTRAIRDWHDSARTG
ncbi:MAG: ABC transporter permease [Ilumatobacter sp.]|uniref:ABC transporter permease n=1 Tax=Ilumatobacter sp. TaxID=1967498 RepID=UPI00329786ED